MSALPATKIDLLLLGLLLDRPKHGYELYQQIRAEGIDAWFNVSMAGVYYSLGKLRDQGLVAESRQGGGRSARKSIYRLTEDGRAAFFSAMEAQATNRERIHLDYDIVIYLLNRLPLQRAIPLLEKHQAFLVEQTQDVQAALAAERDDGRSPLKLAVLDHRRRFLEMEQEWLANVVRDVQGQDQDRPPDAGEQGGLMLLSGNLRHYHLPDLIRLIVSGKHSGTLTTTFDKQIRTLTFENGVPACAVSRSVDDPLTSPPVRERVLEGLCDLFRWQEGSFTFDQNVGCEDWCVPLQISAEELILCGCRFVDNWAIIQRLVPSADTIFEVGMAPDRLDLLTLAPVEEKILASVDGVRDVASIARELELTVFEASRTFYCLTAIGVVRPADLDKIRLRRVFREIAELMCSSTVAWRTLADDRTCEEEVNRAIGHLPLCLNRGRIEDGTNPQLTTDELVKMYRAFLQAQLEVVSQRFGRENARRSFDRTLQQLAPELQELARRYSLDRLVAAQVG
jgi:DNA-binding PadR family transcriptional regulator